ncbi:hypothetical protein B0I35DRAFT_514756 [Stachybotrys elegans]|uniref:BTB domain-containing protein n=1 Tax=Stachybotrys elegans TaxID=80388 RepID=A0A8K0SKK7_9HYPO|nr:hypothetical protein B0I35DRAFT_514756 [Stachybotrys elegans]
MASHKLPCLNSDLIKARKDAKFIDYAFVCRGETIPVHKVVACAQSEAFGAACVSLFKDADAQFTIDDYEPAMVHRMVDYLYTGNYNKGIPEECAATEKDPNEQLIIHATMFALADEYLISGLQLVAARNYNMALGGVRMECFLTSLSAVYSTPVHRQELRKRAVAYARQTMPSYLHSKETKELFDLICSENPAFAKELLESFLEEPYLGRCGSCGDGVPIEALQCRCLTCKKGGAQLPRKRSRVE